MHKFIASSLILIANLILLLSGNALAHGGEDHAHPENAVTVGVAGNKPQRLPDGRVYLPKATQYQLGIRTRLAVQASAAKSIELNGHVVMDPNRGARIQPSSGGRIAAPQTGLPMLGSAVKKGQILAWVKPSQSGFEAAQQQAELGDVRSKLKLAEQNYSRLQELAGSVPRKEIEAAAAELSAARTRAAALLQAGAGEALRSPVNGVLASSNVINGQMVDPGMVLFEVIDPKGLQIEALAYDPALTRQIDSAALQGSQLRYLGGASVLRDGALPLLFAPLETLPLALGQVVKIVVQTREVHSGVILPAACVVRDSANQPVVWLLEQSQVLRAVPVGVMPLDGKNVLITSLKAGSRVVTQGANLVNQIR
ncbi:efflux RND transporter periplasmic adaptor subunit [Chitinibacter sp. S2-10]|uniref:efflux RND transporter periplasmic adaptor subunit n=1 Tax=Chitinibacter sp. S2-10 TaxID=3373597 RepID=UPI00397764DC